MTLENRLAFVMCHRYPSAWSEIQMTPLHLVTAQRVMSRGICSDHLTANLLPNLPTKCFDAVGWAAGRASGL